MLADGLALLGATTSAGTVKNKWMFHMYRRPTFKMLNYDLTIINIKYYYESTNMFIKYSMCYHIITKII